VVAHAGGTRRQQHLRQPLVQVVAAQPGVAVRGQDLEDAAVQLQDGDVERTAAEVVDRDDAVGRRSSP